jgi:negative regulator of sigma E activity
MNCEKCQDLLSDFLDGTLAGDDHGLLNRHLEECLSCVGVRDEFQSISRIAREDCGSCTFDPPNERAMWLRIRNTIEAELDATRALDAKTAAARSATAANRGGFWAGLMSKRWELSLPQLTAAVFALVIGVSVVTALGLQGLRGLDDGTNASTTATASALQASGASRATHVDAAADALYHQAYLQQQQARIRLWEQRVAQRKASWNPQMQNAFDRSINVIDAAVNDSLRDLERDPHDEVSAEMLNAALTDKMELLREFSEQ